MLDRRNSELKVFISHKTEDEKSASSIKNALQYYGPGRLDFFLSEEIQFGEKWNEEIHKALIDSDWLLLLYTDPAQDWDWCLYETGFFAAKAEKKEGRLVCLHSEKVTPPGPLQRWQCVPAISSKLVKLITELLCKSPAPGVDPINPKLKEDSKLLNDIAYKIIRSIGPPKKPEWFTEYITLSLSKKQLEILKKTSQVPSDAKVESSAGSLNIFNIRHNECIWKELLVELKGQDQTNWVLELGKRIQDISISNQICPPALPLFRAPMANEKVYRPLLHRLDSHAGDYYKFCILFYEVPHETDQERGDDLHAKSSLPMAEEGPVPGSRLATVFDLLKIGFLFRRGVLIPHLRKLNSLTYRDTSNAESLEYLIDLESAYLSVKEEAERRLFFDEDYIMAAFSSSEDRSKIIEIINKIWRFSDEILKEKIESRDVDGAIELLEQLKEENLEVIIRSGTRLPDLISEELR